MKPYFGLQKWEDFLSCNNVTTTDKQYALILVESYVDARDEVNAVPNGVRLPPITMTTRTSSSATVEAPNRQKAHEKDR